MTYHRTTWVPRRDIPPSASLRDHLAAQLQDRNETATFEDALAANARSYSPMTNAVAVREAVELAAHNDAGFRDAFIAHD